MVYTGPLEIMGRSNTVSGTLIGQFWALVLVLCRPAWYCPLLPTITGGPVYT
jgi:hypothetical protein